MSCTCSACRAEVTPVRPSFAARLGFYAALATTVIGLGLCPFLGFALFTLAPVIIAFGMAIGPLADDAFARPLCPACGKYFVAIEEAAQPMVARIQTVTTMRA